MAIPHVAQSGPARRMEQYQQTVGHSSWLSLVVTKEEIMKDNKHFNVPITVTQTRSTTGESKMFKPIAKFGAVLVFFGLLAACTNNPVYHKTFMRGQIVGVEENEVVLCIGSKDGAKVGQTLDVYRVAYKTPTQEGESGYKRNYIGEVSINAIVNEHFARASVNRGDAELHDIVELER